MTGTPPRAGTYFLGRYRVVDEIGQGGMASVHLARMDGPGGFQKWVAIKRIHAHLTEDDQFVHMFLDEARIAARISHANVSQVFDLGETDGTYWIAMEYLHGEPLREVMRCVEEGAARMDPSLAAKIIGDAAEGLHSAHDLRGKNNELMGLVHRDVTPHNLFVTYEGTTKVVDFGIAKVAGRLSSTRAGTLKGKLAYMSPEQVRGQEIDRRTDIFALGVTLWELTTGHRLFRMDSDLETLEKVQNCVVPPPSSIVPDYPPDLESVVMQALSKNKERRFQTARDFSRALQQHLMRRGVLIGNEEVASYMRHIFGDRMRQRDAHLSWAAEVTQTLSIDDIQNVPKPAGSGEISLQSYDSGGPGRVPAPRPAAGAPVPRPSAPTPAPSSQNQTATARPPSRMPPVTAPMPAARPQPGVVPPARPSTLLGAPPVRTAAMPAAAAPNEGLAKTVAPGVRKGAPPPAPLPGPAPLPSFGEDTSSSNEIVSLMEDDDEDENLVTVIAPQRSLVPEHLLRAPPPAAGIPSTPQLAGSTGQIQIPQMRGSQASIPGPQYQPPPTAQYSPAAYPPAPYNAPPHAPPVSMSASIPGTVPAYVPPPAQMAVPAAETTSIHKLRRGPSPVLIGLVALISIAIIAVVGLAVFGRDSGTPAAAGSATPTATATATQVPTVSTVPTTLPVAPAATSSPPTVSLNDLTDPTKKPAATPTSTGASAGTTAATPTATDKPERPTGEGKLSVVCVPACDSVSAGSRGLGPSPVVTTLPAGSYTLSLRRKGAASKSVGVTINAGSTTPVRVSME